MLKKKKYESKKIKYLRLKTIDLMDVDTEWYKKSDDYWINKEITILRNEMLRLSFK